MDTYVRRATGGTQFIAAGPCLLRGYYMTNESEDSFMYVHLFDTVGTHSTIAGVKWTIALPVSSGVNVSWEHGILFENSLSVTVGVHPNSIGFGDPVGSRVVLNLIFELLP